jgi:hypothetical protein
MHGCHRKFKWPVVCCVQIGPNVLFCMPNRPKCILFTKVMVCCTGNQERGPPAVAWPGRPPFPALPGHDGVHHPCFLHFDGQPQRPDAVTTGTNLFKSRAGDRYFFQHTDSNLRSYLYSFLRDVWSRVGQSRRAARVGGFWNKTAEGSSLKTCRIIGQSKLTYRIVTRSFVRLGAGTSGCLGAF